MSIRRIVAVAATGAMAVLGAAMPPAAHAAPSGTHVWTKLNPGVSAPARGGMTMAYDPVSRSVVTFGGWDQNIQYLNQTWVWNGTEWAQPTAQTPPTARAAAGMAFDQVTRQLVLFGGWNGTTGTRFGDTWTWDGSTQQWTKQTPAHNPVAVSGPMLFPDPINGHVDMVGGFDGRIYQNTTYQWTGGDWTALNPATSITGRGSAIAELDRADGEVVVFSGIGSLRVDDTWTFDGTTWMQESPAHQPPQRFDSASAYSPRLHGVVVFGGGSPDGNLNDTWEWNGTDWRQLHPGTPPARRDSPGMAYDQATRMIVMFGGDVNGNPAGDTWGL